MKFGLEILGIGCRAIFILVFLSVIVFIIWLYPVNVETYKVISNNILAFHILGGAYLLSSSCWCRRTSGSNSSASSKFKRSGGTSCIITLHRNYNIRYKMNLDKDMYLYLGACSIILKFSWIVLVMVSKYCLLFAFSWRVTTSGCSEKSGAKYSKYSKQKR